MAKRNSNPIDAIKSYLATLDLADQRALLVSESQSSAFPGSAEAEMARKCREMLEAFDLAHPEIAEAIRAANEAARAERLSGRDILGM